MKPSPQPENTISFSDFKSQILNDYRLATLSRECSLLGRKEVLTGKAKFGIFGDGKELPQLAMARAFQNGDFRSGYYRDQTLMMALGILNPVQFFHGLYATTDIEKEPMSAGRQMGGHFGTHSLDEMGNWKDLTLQKNSSSDISCTAGQMPRLLGLAQASKIYRQLDINNSNLFSKNGNEVAWGTIGNASTSEGHFFEVLNAAGVLQVPMIISIWDDGYGISVANEHHTTKADISKILAGFQRDEENNGYELLQVSGWDYTGLIHAYENASELARENHIPVLIHVTELTQPQGHSTSGSHERYKSNERLKWEEEYDCNKKFRTWIIENLIATEGDLEAIENSCRSEVLNAKKQAWKEHLEPLKKEQQKLLNLLKPIVKNSKKKSEIFEIAKNLAQIKEPIKKDLIATTRTILRKTAGETTSHRMALISWLNESLQTLHLRYSSHLYREGSKSITQLPAIPPTYPEEKKEVDGRVLLRDNFFALFQKYDNVLVFGEDTGKIGDVNQGLEGLQNVFGEIRVADTGIRETSIIGQGIGMALRGLRPIAEVQYLDYIYYTLQTLTDDLATLHYRTNGKQIAPLIIRTRGHRLEGIWHSGSPMGTLVHSLRGINLLVPRDMTQAAGFYNTLLKGQEPAVVIESLNGYRLKETLPTNLGEFCTPIGQVEVMRQGKDLTIVSYGSTLRIVLAAAEELKDMGISVEVIDAQSLLPFDLSQQCSLSVKKTNRLLVVDEDVPGGCAAYLMQEIIEKQKAFSYLDSAPQTLTAKPHRPAYSTDGDYFSKPSKDDVIEKVYQIMHEVNPNQFPKLF